MAAFLYPTHMDNDQRLSRRTAIRVLERACAADKNSTASLTSAQVAHAARSLGLSEEAMLDSMSAEMDGAWRTVLLGRPSFRARVQLDGTIARGELVECLAAAGFGRGEVRASGDGITWQRNMRHERLRVSADRANLDLTAERSIVLGFVPWFGWGAGVASAAAVLGVVWPMSEPPVAALVLAAVVGFSAARAAWNRILSDWRTQLAHCVHRLEAELHQGGYVRTVERGA